MPKTESCEFCSETKSNYSRNKIKLRPKEIRITFERNSDYIREKLHLISRCFFTTMNHTPELSLQSFISGIFLKYIRSHEQIYTLPRINIYGPTNKYIRPHAELNIVLLFCRTIYIYCNIFWFADYLFFFILVRTQIKNKSYGKT